MYVQRWVANYEIGIYNILAGMHSSTHIAQSWFNRIISKDVANCTEQVGS